VPEEHDDRRSLEPPYGHYQARWYGWASPVGLGLFFLLIALTVAVVRVAFR